MTNAHAFDPERVARVSSALAADDHSQSSLCVASAGVARVSGAGVVLMMHGRALGTVCSSDPVAETVEELQYTSGEGPCVDAFSTRQPVLVPDLGADEVVRWPGFRDGALAVGVRAVFGFPILVGPVCIGALNLYHNRSGALTDEQLADATVVAHVAGRTVLDWQSVAGEGSLARQLEHVPTNRAVVHQATGMISVQASMTVGDAVALLRAYAFSTNRPISDVASDVVRGDLRFG
jgi:transcriptional regulator with GAF, ATPase, and Fis domain